tara:strand:- start:670 stop:936 length:267 start_codon:yes stop_codon:yes gene_type:complete
MADINQIITLGIGTPGGIPEFITLGLQIGSVVSPWDVQTLDSTAYNVQSNTVTTWTEQTDNTPSWSAQADDSPSWSAQTDDPTTWTVQ